MHSKMIFFKYRFFRTFSVIAIAAHVAAIANDLCYPTVLELDEAYGYVLEYNLKAKSAEINIDIRQAERRQVGFYPNPEFNISLDGPSNAGNWVATNNDFSAGITQLFELGGKRRARVKIAEAANCVSSWEFEILKCDLFAELLHGFVDTAIAQEKLSLAKELQEISESSLKCIMDKSSCGKSSLLDEKKAQISLKMAKLNFNKRLVEVQNAKNELASLWADEHPEFQSVNYDLFNIEPPPPYGQLEDELDRNPELSRMHAELTKFWAIKRFERSRRIPNMAVYLGVSTTRNLHNPSLSAGINIPLPIFDRNQGNIAKAGLEFNQAVFKQMDLINNLRIRLKILYKEWTTAYLQAADLKDILETVAEDSLKLAEERYKLGNSDYLDFLDARTTLFNIKQQFLDAVEDYHHKRTEIIQLLAKCCSEVFDRE